MEGKRMTSSKVDGLSYNDDGIPVEYQIGERFSWRKSKWSLRESTNLMAYH